MSIDEPAEITQHLLRFSPDALVVVDDQGRIRFANDTVTELFGYAPAQLIVSILDMLVPERLRGRIINTWAAISINLVIERWVPRSPSLFARRADGTEFAAGIRLAPFRIGEKLYVAAAIRDATERRQINDDLVAAREEADRANRAREPLPRDGEPRPSPAASIDQDAQCIAGRWRKSLIWRTCCNTSSRRSKEWRDC